MITNRRLIKGSVISWSVSSPKNWDNIEITYLDSSVNKLASPGKECAGTETLGSREAW